MRQEGLRQALLQSLQLPWQHELQIEVAIESKRKEGAIEQLFLLLASDSTFVSPTTTRHNSNQTVFGLQRYLNLKHNPRIPCKTYLTALNQSTRGRFLSLIFTKCATTKHSYRH
jgi:hypothetical protein